MPAPIDGTRGRVKAYDAKDGRLVWTFYTIPGPGEPGHETWPKGSDAWKYGGASVWQTPAIDPELGLVYFSTGNAGPDYNGAVRAGDNLYAVSMVAIDAKTGKYRWHFQQVHHDIWDYDAVNPVILMDVNVGGRTRKAIAEVGKTGWAYILDRQTGKPLIGIDERPVPQEPRQATARDAAVPARRRRGAAADRGRARGHRSWSTTAASSRRSSATTRRSCCPASGAAPTGRRAPTIRSRQRLFVCASSVVNGYTGGGDPNLVPPGTGPARCSPAAPTTFTRVPRSGIIAALDVTTNKLAWRYQWPDQCYSGMLATGGGLLFVGRADGRLTALDSATGKQLWEFQTGAGMHAPASTFEHKGKQYVIAFSAGSALLGPRAATASGCSVSTERCRRCSRARRCRGRRRCRAAEPNRAALRPRRPRALGRRESRRAASSSTSRRAWSAMARTARAVMASARRSSASRISRPRFRR